MPSLFTYGASFVAVSGVGSAAAAESAESSPASARSGPNQRAETADGMVDFTPSLTKGLTHGGSRKDGMTMPVRNPVSWQNSVIPFLGKTVRLFVRVDFIR